MKKETIYFDTSIPSAYYDHRAKERQNATIRFWKEKLADYVPHVSILTISELEKTTDASHRKKLLDLVKPFKTLKINNAIENLAQDYVENDIIPRKYLNDAIHAAVATYFKIDYLVSWNFDHLVKVRTRRLLKSMNILKGYTEIEIVSPQEL